MTNQTMDLQAAAREIRNPAGTREFPPDVSKTPFGSIANELATRAVNDFASGDTKLSLSEWNRLRRAIEWRFAHALYEMAYPAADGEQAPGKEG